MEHLDEESANGKRSRAEAPAQWQPMMDVALFKAVCDKPGGHSCRSHGRRRRKKAIFPMRLVCAQCGGKDMDGRLSHGQGRARNHVHTKPKARMDEEGRAAFDATCGKTWYVDADEIGTQVKNIIVQQRSDPSFESEMKALILKRDDFRSRVAGAISKANDQVERRRQALKRLKVMAGKLAGSGDGLDSDDELVDQIKEARQVLGTAETKLKVAQEFGLSRERAWNDLSGIISETRNIAAAWTKITDLECKMLLDYWVLDVLVYVAPVTGKRCANVKTALVTLRTAPNGSLSFEFGKGQSAQAANAARSASKTAGSRAATKAGKSSMVPTLANTETALRFKPTSLARDKGVCLNSSENSLGEVARNLRTSSRASGVAKRSRGAKAVSDASAENLRLYGQTS